MYVQMNGLSLSKILWNAEGGVPYKNIHAEYPFTIKCDFFETPMHVQLNGIFIFLPDNLTMFRVINS